MRNLLALAFVLSSSAALAFGTIDGAAPGGPMQSREHEGITRRALACSGVDDPLPAGQCFDGDALDMLAGRKDTLGAIGWTDVVHFDDHAYHCDNGDYLPVDGYPRSQQDATAALQACRALMIRYMDAAVSDARGLVRNGKPAYGKIPHSFCNFNGIRGDALCNVLEDFGAALHAIQDFYSHSNWVDQPQNVSIALDNPPGLGNSQPTDWLDLSRDAELPFGVITGCYAGGDQGRAKCAGRVTHYTLNKDLGTIPLQGPPGPARTDRGIQSGNFERAVDAATADTRRQWAYLRGRLIATYGAADGNLMICVLENGYQSDVKASCGN